MKTGITLRRRYAAIALLDKAFNFRRSYKTADNIHIYRIATSVYFFIAGLTFATWASRIPDIQNKLHLNDAGLGAVLFALPAGLMISLPLSGLLVSRFGSKKMVLTGALLYPLILIPLSLAGSVFQLVSALFLFGIASNLINIAMNTQAVSVEKIYGKSIMASFHGLWSLAVFAGALIGTFFVSQGLSTAIHFSIIALAAFVLAVSSYKFILPDAHSDKQQQKLFAKPDRSILLLGFIAFCCLLCEGAMADWSGVYFKKVVLAPSSLITIGYVAFSSTMAIGRFAGDWLVTRFGTKKMLQLSGLLITTGLMIATLHPSIITATAGFLLVGFGVSSVVPIVYGIAGKSETIQASTALAAVSTIGFLGFLAGPPLIGFIAQAISLRWAFVVIALLGFGTSILAGRLKKNNSSNYKKNYMNTTIKDNKQRKRKRDRTNNSLHVTDSVRDISNNEKSRKGFVAWYDDKQPAAITNTDDDILEGRTKNGGYVAYPK